MAVRIRLSRFGRLHRPYFRIIAIDGRRHREGEANEILGSYDPLLADKNIQVDMEKVGAWVARGALISTSLSNLLKHHGYALPAKAAAATPAKKKAEKKPKAKKPAGKKGEKQTFVAASRRSVRQHQAKQKAVRKAKLAEEAAAKAAAAPAADAAAEPAKS